MRPSGVDPTRGRGPARSRPPPRFRGPIHAPGRRSLYDDLHQRDRQAFRSPRLGQRDHLRDLGPGRSPGLRVADLLRQGLRVSARADGAVEEDRARDGDRGPLHDLVSGGRDRCTGDSTRGVFFVGVTSGSFSSRGKKYDVIQGRSRRGLRLRSATLPDVADPVKLGSEPARDRRGSSNIDCIGNPGPARAGFARFRRVRPIAYPR